MPTARSPRVPLAVSVCRLQPAPLPPPPIRAFPLRA